MLSDRTGDYRLFSPLIEHAIELSAQWHESTYRKGGWRDPAFEVPEEELLRVPVAAHVMAVGQLVQRAGWDDATVAAAFLHDAIEDGNQYGNEMRFEELRSLLGDEVAERVREVTERKYDADGSPRSWRARKLDYVSALKTVSDGAVAISLADKLHNLWSINAALEQGIDVFVARADRSALAAGPAGQLWFFEAVLEASRDRDDRRLLDLHADLVTEVRRFRTLTEQA